MHARKNKEGRGRGKKEKKEGKRGWDITKRDTCTDDKIKAAASIAELFRWPKIGNDGVSWFKGTAGGFECFRGCTNCGTIDNRERLRKKGRINWSDEIFEILAVEEDRESNLFPNSLTFLQMHDLLFVVRRTSSKNL